jgi:hypothetical protein
MPNVEAAIRARGAFLDTFRGAGGPDGGAGGGGSGGGGGAPDISGFLQILAKSRRAEEDAVNQNTLKLVANIINQQRGGVTEINATASDLKASLAKQRIQNQAAAGQQAKTARQRGKSAKKGLAKDTKALGSDVALSALGDGLAGTAAELQGNLTVQNSRDQQFQGALAQLVQQTFGQRQSLGEASRQGFLGDLESAKTQAVVGADVKKTDALAQIAKEYAQQELQLRMSALGGGGGGGGRGGGGGSGRPGKHYLSPEEAWDLGKQYGYPPNILVGMDASTLIGNLDFGGSSEGALSAKDEYEIQRQQAADKARRRAYPTDQEWQEAGGSLSDLYR